MKSNDCFDKILNSTKQVIFRK